MRRRARPLGRRARARAGACSPFLRATARSLSGHRRASSWTQGARLGDRCCAGASRRRDVGERAAPPAARRWRWRSRSAISPANSTLEAVTAALSDFADEAIDRALAAAIAERVPGAGADGLRRPRARQARQPRAQLFLRRRPDPAVRSRRRCRGASARSPARRRCGSAGGWSSCCSSGPRTAMSPASTCGCGRRRK